MHDFIGRWRIHWMETWSEDYVHLNEPGFFKFDESGPGIFVFGEFSANMDVCVSTREPMLEYSWLGKCKGHELSGRGFFHFPTPDEGEGALFIHRGGRSGVRVRRET